MLETIVISLTILRDITDYSGQGNGRSVIRKRPDYTGWGEKEGVREYENEIGNFFFPTAINMTTPQV